MTRPKAPAVQITPITITVDELQNVTGLGKTFCYQLLNDGAFESFYVGKRKMVLYSSVVRWAESEIATQNAQIQQKGS